MPSSKWWNSLSKSQKAAHIKEHPNSIYATGRKVMRDMKRDHHFRDKFAMLGAGAASGYAFHNDINKAITNGVNSLADSFRDHILK